MVSSSPPTSKFFQTTHPHKDHTRDAHGNAHLVTTSTAFVFMEDNDDAHFTIGSMSIPVVKGSLVRFNGAHSHHTIINSGSVEMLGPFEGGWLSAVGWAATPDFETESPTDVLSSTSSKSGKASSSNGTSSPTATKSSKSKAAKLFKGKASGSRSSTTSSESSADNTNTDGAVDVATTIEETADEDLPKVLLEAHDFDLTSMSMLPNRRELNRNRRRRVIL